MYLVIVILFDGELVLFTFLDIVVQCLVAKIGSLFEFDGFSE